jgi:hypothetical protein
MKYFTPELVVLGSASTLVLGGPFGRGDNVLTDETQPMVGVALGLDE